MSLADQQRFLARVCTDPRIRERFCAEPARVAAELQLAPADQSWCADLSRTELAGFALSLRRKRFQEIRKLLPASARLLDLSFHHALWQRFSAREAAPEPDAVSMAIRFADFLVEPANLAGPRAALTRDLVRYEQARLQALRVRWLVRWFRHPVGEWRARVLRGETGPEERRFTIGIWIRCSRRGPQRQRLIHPIPI